MSGGARMPSDDALGGGGLTPNEQYAVLLAAILGAPVTSWAEEPERGKASGPYVHSWYPDLLSENDDGQD